MRHTWRKSISLLLICFLGLVSCGGGEKGNVSESESVFASDDGAESETVSGHDAETDDETDTSWENAAAVVEAAGLIPDDENAAESNLNLLNTLIDGASSDTVIRLPSGTYFMASNRISGGILLVGKNRIALEGQGTQLINVSYDDTVYQSNEDYPLSNVFGIYGCENIVIRGITVRYSSPSSLSGVITGYDGERTVIKALSGNAAAGGEYVYCVSLFSEENVPGDECYLSNTSTDDLIHVADDTYSFAGKYGSVGDRICLRFTSATYAAPLFNVIGVGGLTLADITVSGCPGAVCIATGDNRDMTLEHIQVVSPDDREMLFSSNQDGFHIKSMRGSLIMRDCTFVGLGDDALNIHALMGRVESVNGSTVTATTPGTSSALDAGWAQAGDEIAFYDEKLNLLGVSNVVRSSQGSLELEAVPGGAGEGTLLHNRSNAPDVTVSGCYVERSRARAFLIQSKTAVIQNCTLRNIRLSGILVAPDTRNWYEMGPVQEVTVSGCTFEQVGTVIGDHAAVCVRVCHDSTSLLGGTEPIHGSISVTGNTFVNCRHAVFIRRAASASVQNNTYERCRFKEDIE